MDSRNYTVSTSASASSRFVSNNLRLVGKAQIVIDDSLLPAKLADAMSVLVNNKADIYQRGGQLVRPVNLIDTTTRAGITFSSGTLLLDEVSPESLRVVLTGLANWVKLVGSKETFKSCPLSYAKALMVSKDLWRFRTLVGVSGAPTIRMDGSLITVNGYDEASGIYLDYRGPAIEVEPHPDMASAKSALQVLSEPLEEFPFESEIDKSVALAHLLTALIKRTLGPTPYIAIDATTRGSGKSLLADVGSLISTGHVSTAIGMGADVEETEKRFASVLLCGAEFLNVDNVEQPIDGLFWSVYSTLNQLNIRPLGVSKQIPIDTGSTYVVFTGNNIRVKTELLRKMLRCRIDPRMERPDSRRFRRNLREWVPQNRHRLIQAALTLLSAYRDAGCPFPDDKPPHGDYRAWDKWVRGPLLWMGLADPAESRRSLEEDEEDSNGLAELMEAWQNRFPRDGVTVARAVEEANTAAKSLNDCDNRRLFDAIKMVAYAKDGSLDQRALGNFIRARRGEIINGRCFEKTGEFRRYAKWKVKGGENTF